MNFGTFCFWGMGIKKEAMQASLIVAEAGLEPATFGL